MLNQLRNSWRLRKQVKAERAALFALCSAQLTGSRLGKIGGERIAEIFASRQINDEWPLVKKEIDDVIIIEDMTTAGVNPGDRRAIYYLVRALKPERILEIGTNVGASTIHITAATKRNMLENVATNYFVTSVDILDVNEGANPFWKRSDLPRSPRECVAELGMGNRTAFVTESSLLFLGRCRQEFDLIFLDGDHAAPTVYQEIHKALPCLRNGGSILLHDYFPRNRPLWSNGAVVPGPYLAGERLREERANVSIVPLGRLPWPTKLGSNLTSLAIMSRAI